VEKELLLKGQINKFLKAKSNLWIKLWEDQD